MTHRTVRRWLKLNLELGGIAIFTFILTMPLMGCLLVGGYSSRGGFFVWPGSIALIIVGLLVSLLIRRRR